MYIEKNENEGSRGDRVRPDDPLDINQNSKNTEESSETDTFDPLIAKDLPGMAKEEIMDLIVEKMIQKGQKMNKKPEGIL
ncbi:hypothetical protein ACNF42_05780 [Cuniculiplasma sp. SKW3]|uniref:hypothetical protein n=1 Tax=unclassified Cuniculiplasma TaxID=2619706 RepID=UPI003FCF4B82